jgi:hypothetical protein
LNPLPVGFRDAIAGLEGDCCFSLSYPLPVGFRGAIAGLEGDYRVSLAKFGIFIIK